MKMLPTNERENLLRTVRFDTPDYIPMRFSINNACWFNYDKEALQDLMAEHPFLFPDFKKSADKIPPPLPQYQVASVPYKDDWGCVWETSENGITGVVTKHPLADWNDFKSFTSPDPKLSNGLVPINWHKEKCEIKEAKTCGRLIRKGLRHGHTFLQLIDIRGYENLLFDMTDKNQNLYKLIDMIEQFNLAIIKKYITLGAEWMSYPEDLGMQVGPMLSPKQFRKFIKPSYQRIIAPAQKADCIIHMHSDGDIRSLIDDLIDASVEVLNLQDLVNGLDWIKENLVSKVCIELDVDRQHITPFGTPAQIDELIRQEVEMLGSKQGGLMMVYGLYPNVPLENAKAVMDAMEKYAGYYS